MIYQPPEIIYGLLLLSRAAILMGGVLDIDNLVKIKTLYRD